MLLPAFVTCVQATLQSQKLLDETFVYSQQANEQDQILGVLDTPMVLAMQRRLAEAVDVTETQGELVRVVQAGVNTLTDSHNRMIDAVRVCVPPPFRCCFVRSTGFSSVFCVSAVGGGDE